MNGVFEENVKTISSSSCEYYFKPSDTCLLLKNLIALYLALLCNNQSNVSALVGQIQIFFSSVLL